jgi:hypothetical protein
MALTKITGEGVGAVDNLTVDTNTLVVDAANNRVGVREASPAAPLHISTAASTTAEIRLTANNTGSGSGDRGRIAVYSSRNDGTAYEAGRIEIDRSSGTEDKAHILFATNDGSGVTERLRILSGGGLTFNGDTAAANALDDYEEGTWTPQISATDGIGTLTYSAQVGHYTKIGNRVNFHMYVLINQKGTVAGSIRYTLPFSSASVTNLYTAVSFWVNNSVNGQVFDGDFHLQAYIAPGSSIVVPQSLDGDGGVTHLNAGHISNGTDVMIAGHYSV